MNLPQKYVNLFRFATQNPNRFKSIYFQPPVRRVSIEKVSKNLLSSLNDEEPLDVSTLLEGMKRKRIKPSNYVPNQ